jgi:hypothetical protein
MGRVIDRPGGSNQAAQGAGPGQSARRRNRSGPPLPFARGEAALPLRNGEPLGGARQHSLIWRAETNAGGPEGRHLDDRTQMFSDWL